MASASAAGSLATARPNARSLRASAWRVEKAALLSQGGPSRRARSARGAGASRGRTGAVVVEAKIWTDDGRRRAAELMGLTREVRPSPRAAPRPARIFFIFLSRALFPDCSLVFAILAGPVASFRGVSNARRDEKYLPGAREDVADGASVERRRRWESRLVFWSRRFS
jgi:hypothetical protein